MFGIPIVIPNTFLRIVSTDSCENLSTTSSKLVFWNKCSHTHEEANITSMDLAAGRHTVSHSFYQTLGEVIYLHERSARFIYHTISTLR